MQPCPPDHPREWAQEGLRFHTLSHFFGRRFGGRVWKISIDAGLSCPNRDGTLASEGCVFCDMRSFSPSRRLEGFRLAVADQVSDGIQHLRRRYGHKASRFLAYFQPATNTYGPPEKLRTLWSESLRCPEVVGLAVGTRPDCVGEEILDVLAGFTSDKWVSVELGLQSIHQASLDWLKRGHDFHCFEESAARARDRGLHVGAHLMLGLPCETSKQMIQTAKAMARLQVNSVKLHNLYVVRNTPLAGRWKAGEFRLPQRDEYVGMVVDFLECLSPDCVVDRIAGDAPRQFLLAPDWCRDKTSLRQAVEAEFDRRGTRQGSRWVPAG